MRAVDLFAGWGGLTLGSQQAGVPVVWAANHHPMAVATHALNHPQTEHVCQDLRQADWTALPDYDLLLAAPACFGPETTVLTARGVVYIPDVVRGDLVLTHRGRWRLVVATMSRQSDTVDLGYTETTADHRYYSREQKYRWFNAERRYAWSLVNPRWTPAGDLHGKFVATPMQAEGTKIPSGAENLRLEDWYMIGRWLGDGWLRHVPVSTNDRRPRSTGVAAPAECLQCGAPTALNLRHPHLYRRFCSRGCAGNYGRKHRKQSRHDLSICTGHADTDVLRRALQLTGRVWGERVTRTSTVFTTSSADLVHLVEQSFGRGAAGKTVPGWILGLPRMHRVALFNGYMDADGSPTKNGWKSTTVSKQLAVGIRLLAISLGYTCNISRTKCVPSRQIEGRTVVLQPYQWTVGVVVGAQRDRYTRAIGGLRWTKQRKAPVPARTNVTVYDLTVAEDHSFVADGYVVHNCQGHSPASRPRRRAYHDALRATAMAVVDCADVTEPKAIVVENVPSFTEWRLYDWWCDGLRKLGYDLDVRTVLASQHGVAQRRKRLFVLATRPGVRVGPLLTSPDEPAFGPLLQEDIEHDWRPVADATAGVRLRIERSARRHGPRFLTQHTTDHHGVPLHEPIRTITTAAQHWNLVDGDRYRPLTGRELARGMGFPDDFTWPAHASVAEVTRGIGNSVCPPVGRAVVAAVADAAA